MASSSIPNASFMASVLLASLLATTARGQVLFVSNAGAGVVGEYTQTGQVINASLIRTGGLPSGLVVSGSNIFVANQSLGTIGEYTTSGGTINASLVTGLTSPSGLVLSGSDLFVANFSGGLINEYTTSGVLVNSFQDAAYWPEGMVLSGSNLFIASLEGGVISEYTTSGAEVNANLITGLNYPYGLALSGSDPILFGSTLASASTCGGFAPL
jgi:hypothetical protein